MLLLGKSATIFLNELKNGINSNKHANRYSEEMKRFALTMHYNSPKAYRVLRYLLFLQIAANPTNYT